MILKMTSIRLASPSVSVQEHCCLSTMFNSGWKMLWFSFPAQLQQVLCPPTNHSDWWHLKCWHIYFKMFSPFSQGHSVCSEGQAVASRVLNKCSIRASWDSDWHNVSVPCTCFVLPSGLYFLPGHFLFWYEFLLNDVAKCEKWRSITQSQGAEEYPTWNK